MMISATGCLALLAYGMAVCFSPGSDGRPVIYCSDTPVSGVPTCEDYNRRMSAEIERMKRTGCMSQDGSSSSCAFTAPIAR